MQSHWNGSEASKKIPDSILPTGIVPTAIVPIAKVEDPITNYLHEKITDDKHYEIVKKRVHSKAWHSIRVHYKSPGKKDEESKTLATKHASSHVQRWSKLVKRV